MWSSAATLDSGELMVIKRDTGNVGIGTTAPGSQLEVTAANASSTGTIINMAASATANPIQIEESDGDKVWGITSQGCQFRYYINTSVAVMSSGTAVEQDEVAVADMSVTTAAAGAVDAIGFVQDVGGCADAAKCEIGYSGTCYMLLNTDEACVVGDWISSGDEIGRAQCSTSPAAAPTHFEEYGHAATNVPVAGGVVLGQVHFL